MNSKPLRHGEPWTEVENKRLGKLFDSGLSLYRLSVRHQRTEGAILGQLVRIGKLVQATSGKYYRADALWYDYREHKHE